MILSPAIIALVLVSILLSLMAIYASWFGLQIVMHWNINSGNEEQLLLERKTYLVSTIISYLFVFQIGSLFLYIYTADSLRSIFVGAMCAAGTLNVNSYGYPTLMIKMINVILAGLWLVLNYTDNKAYDYPLIKKKYTLLILMVPLIIVESAFLTLYFMQLKGNLITSCCGSLFSGENRGLDGGILTLPVKTMMVLFSGSFLMTFASGIFYWVTGKKGLFFSFSSIAFFIIAGLSFISFISLYFYELPTHHCPFCVLQREYGYVGYLLYATLISGCISGLGIGVLTSFVGIPSIAVFVPRLQKRLTVMCLISYLIFSGISIIRIFTTGFTVGLCC